MRVSALWENSIHYGFSLSVFPKLAISGPGREKRDVVCFDKGDVVCDSCDFTK